MEGKAVQASIAEALNLLAGYGRVMKFFSNLDLTEKGKQTFLLLSYSSPRVMPGELMI